MTHTNARPAPPEDDEVTPLQVAIAIWAGRKTIAVAIVLALLMGTFFLLRTESSYKADGLLQLEPKSSSLALPSGMQDLLGAGSRSPSEAEIEIMKSHLVLGEAVQTLNLQIFAQPRKLPVLGVLPSRLNLPDPGIKVIAPYQWGNEAISVGELELKSEWFGEEMVLTITGPGTYALDLPDGSTIDGTVQLRLAQAKDGFSLVVDRLDGPTGRQFTLMLESLPEAVIKLQEQFTVSESPRGSSILRVSFTDPSPRRAEMILDAISQSYVSQNIARSSAEAQNSLVFIENQLPIAEQATLAAQDVLNAYRQKQNSVDVNYETRSLLERATRIETELSELSLKEEELKDRYTINHPVYQALLQNRATQKEQLEELRTTTAALPETQKEIFNLTRDLEVAQQVYVQLLNRQQELRVLEASTVGSVRIIDRAYARDIRIWPRTSVILGISMVLGLVMGAAYVLVRQAMHSGIRGAQEIEALGLPVFATVTYLPAAADHRKLKGFLPIHALTSPDDVVVEALRSLRTSLHFGMLDATSKSILFTSAAPAAGKSFIAVNLAAVAAQAGQKVCIIDADLRKGYMRRYFSLEKDTPGLSEYLAGEKTKDEVLRKGPTEGLFVITSGRFPPNPSELLMRAEFEQLLVALDKTFDLVIIDAPPTLAVTDPVVIGRYAGARILVARHMETVVGEVDAVRRSFENTGSKLTGAILNGYKASAVGHLGDKYQSYNYRYSYQSHRNFND